MTSLDFGVFSRLAIALAEFGLTWWLQSAILLLAGLLAARLLARRGPAIQSMVYRVTLVAVLVCPLATYVLSLANISLLTFDLQSRLTAQLVETDPENNVADASQPVAIDTLLPSNSPIADPVNPQAALNQYQLSQSHQRPDNQSTLTEPAAAPPISEVPTLGALAASSSASGSARWPLRLAVGLSIVWLLGAAAYTFQLVRDLWQGVNLRRASDAADADATTVCHDVATLLNVRSPGVLINPFINSPCLLGHWHSVVLLPDETPATTYREVFLHELAHLRRGDWLWNVIGRVTKSLLWCQPLLWVLLRRDAVAAEEVCDDYVLHHGGNRDGYLHQLVEIAARTLPQPASAGIAMISFQSKLTQRTRRILDTTRVLSTNVGRWFACGALIATFIATAAVATIDVGTPANAQSEPSKEADNGEAGKEVPPPTDAATPITALNDDPIIHVTGRVVDPDGKPVREAAVRVVAYGASKPLAELTTNAQGEFEVEYDKSQFPELDWHSEPWRAGAVCVNATGFGVAWATGSDLASNPTPEFRLVEDDVPIVGQILSLEGQPINKAIIRITSITEGDGEDIDEVWKNINKHPDLAESYIGGQMRNLAGRHAALALTVGTKHSEDDNSFFMSVLTDESGKFEFSGVGVNRIVRADIYGPSIQSTQIYIVTAPAIDYHWPPKEISDSARIGFEIGRSMPQIYPANFEHLAKPSRPISGVVRDNETGKPIAGIGVSGDVFGQGDRARDATDENGRYTLTGLATQGELRLYATPRRDKSGTILPYIGAERDSISFSNASPPTPTDFSLVRGVVVHGVVRDEEGHPVKANVKYLGHDENEFLQNLPDKLSPYQTTVTDEDGQFELVVPPGLGALAISAPLRERESQLQYQKARAEDFGLPIDDEGWIISTNHGYQDPGGFEAGRIINFSMSDEPDLRITLTKVSDVATLRFVNDEGKRFESVRIAGKNPQWKSFDRLGDGRPTILVQEAQKHGRRPVVASDYEGQFALALFAPDDPRTPHLSDFPQDDRGIYSIELQPAATITGRLVDATGSEVTKGKVNVLLANPAADGTTVLDKERLIEYPELEIDDDGSFEFKGLPATGPYVLAVSSAEGTGIVKTDIQLAKGETLDLGALDVTTAINSDTSMQDAAVRDANATIEVAQVTTEPATPQAQQTDNEKQPTNANRPQVYEGQVLTPDGQPAVGAVVQVAPTPWLKLPNVKPVTTGNDGRFRFEIDPQDFTNEVGRDTRYLFSILASAEGYGLASNHSLAFEPSGRLRSKLTTDKDARESIKAYYDSPPAEFEKMLVKQQSTLRLRPKQSIRGRLIDTEGKPIVGADVTIRQFRTGWDGTLDAWFTAKDPPPQHFQILTRSTPNWIYGQVLRDVVPKVTSDDAGEFTLDQFSADSLVDLLITAPGFANHEVSVQTRDENKVTVNYTVVQQEQNWFGHTFDLVMPPSIPVRGVVRDKATGKPIEGVKVESIPYFDGQVHSGSSHAHDVTDADGRFELLGLPQAKRSLIEFNAGKLRYMSASMDLDLTANVDQQIEMTLLPGVRVRGRVTDENGNGVQGQVAYLAHKDHPKVGEIMANLYTSGFADVADDSFEITVQYGPGALTFETWDEKYEKRIPWPEEFISVSGMSSFMMMGAGQRKLNAVKHINIENETTDHEFELRVKRATVLVGTLVDQAGQPVSGATYSGRTESPMWHATDGDTFTVFGRHPDELRRLTFVHRERKLACTLLLQGGQGKAPQVQLQPWGSIHGRVINNHGDPIPDFSIVTGSFDEMVKRSDATLSLPPQDDTQSAIIITDDEGRFRIDGIVPDVPYGLAGFANSATQSISGDLASGIVVSPGEDKDLGDLTLVSVDTTQKQ